MLATAWKPGSGHRVPVMTGRAGSAAASALDTAQAYPGGDGCHVVFNRRHVMVNRRRTDNVLTSGYTNDQRRSYYMLRSDLPHGTSS